MLWNTDKKSPEAAIKTASGLFFILSSFKRLYLAHDEFSEQREIITVNYLISVYIGCSEALCVAVQNRSAHLCKVKYINSSVAVEIAGDILLVRLVGLPPVYIEEISLFSCEYQINIMPSCSLFDISGLS